MKAELELNLCPRTAFLNFWNAENGKDVVCEVRGSRLFLATGKNPQREISLATFVRMVKIRMREIVKAAEQRQTDRIAKIDGRNPAV